MADIIVSSDIHAFMQSADIPAARANLNLPTFPYTEQPIRIEDNTQNHFYEIVAGNLQAIAAADVTCTLPDLGAADVFVFADHPQVLQSKTMDYAFNTFQNFPVELVVACSDETTDLTTGTAKVTFRMPHAMTLDTVRASVNTAPTGSTIIVDINEDGSTILSTKLSIDASEKTSLTAATAAVISDTALADDAEITIDIDQVGSTIAGKGLKIVFIGTR